MVSNLLGLVFATIGASLFCLVAAHWKVADYHSEVDAKRKEASVLGLVLDLDMYETGREVYRDKHSGETKIVI